MTGNDALTELLARVGASHDGTALIAEAELFTWPGAAVAVMKANGLLAPAEPARHVVCEGCERQCSMPVEFVSTPAGASRTFVVCDKRDDINRVDVPLDALMQWQANGEAVAGTLAKLLNVHRSTRGSSALKRWDVGVLRSEHSAHMVLAGDGALVIELAGHAVPLLEVLSVRGKSLALQRKRLAACVDHPAAGGGSPESGEQRAARLLIRCEGLQSKGHRNFQKIVAREEGVSVETIKKLLAKARGHRRKGVSGSPP